MDWTHGGFKLCAWLYIFLMAWIAWQILPYSGHWTVDSGSLQNFQDSDIYFRGFRGSSDCNVKSTSLHIRSSQHYLGTKSHETFCRTRKDLLQSMSNGGRIGFDTPYIPRDCQYMWHDVAQICMILERFDGLIFIGDESLQQIYNGFNILLRQDLAHGTLQTWDMDTQALSDCRCDNQFMRAACVEKSVTSSEQVMQNSAIHSNAYTCDRTPHTFLRIGSSSPSETIIAKFRKMAPQAPPSNYKHIPIIYSLSPATSSSQSAVSSLLSVLKMADDTKRATDILFIGPTAAGHIYIKDRKNNQEIWDFHHTVAKTARENDVDVLGMWNLTVQATSWDGMRFGTEVAITQAMMMINWLARLETG